MHAAYSVKELGTALFVLGPGGLGGALVPLGESDECLGEFRRVNDLEVHIQQADVEGQLVWRV